MELRQPIDTLKINALIDIISKIYYIYNIKLVKMV